MWESIHHDFEKECYSQLSNTHACLSCFYGKMSTLHVCELFNGGIAEKKV